MPRIPLEFPLGGLNDSMAFSKQPYRTTRDIVNMRGVDPITGRIRGAQRSGIQPHVTGSPQVNGTNKVQCLASITFDNRKVTYANLSPTASDLASVLTPNKADVSAVVTDPLSNVYLVDGLAGLAKYNSGLILQWKVSLPAQDDAHVVRALAVSDTGLVFAGVSSGGKQEKTRLWCYEQLEDNKTNLLWEIDPEAYVEQIVISDEKLYTIQNDTDTNEAGLVVYSGLGTINPTVVLRRALSAPLNGLAVGKDGSIYFCSPANASRGINTKYPGFTARTADQDMWNPRDLTDFTKRVWSWYDAQQIADFEDNAPMPGWSDQSGHGRDWAIDQGLDSSFNKTWPTYQATGIGGLPSVRFSNIISGASMRFVTGQNGSLIKGYADQQKTAWPGFPGGKFALFFVARFAPEAVQRCMISQSVLSGGDKNRFVVNDAWSAPNGIDNGRAVWVASTLAGGIGAGGHSGAGNNEFADLDWSYGASETVATMVTIIHDAGANPSTNVAQHSVVRINGRPVDRALSATIQGLVHTMLGGRDFGNSSHVPFQGDVGEILVLGPYDAGTATTDPVSGNTDNGGTAKFYPRSIATTVAGSVTASWVSTATNHFNDYEIERIEGYLAHRWGFAHLLPTGTAGVLLFEGLTPNPGNGSTVTLDATTYTFVTAVPAAAYEVQIGADANTSMRALVKAINLTGVAGTDYGIGTVEHPTARVSWMNTVGTGIGADCNMKVESKGSSTTGLTTTLVAAGGWTGAWGAAATSQTLATRLVGVTSYYPGHYPHPFFLVFGAPRKSIAKMTVLPYTGGTGALPTVGQQITGGTSSAKGRLKEIRWGGTVASGTLVLADVSGTFQAAETITAPNTLTATSGTPQVDGPAFESEPSLLNSTNPILGKLDQNGALKWLLTTRAALVADVGTFPAVQLGGVGWGVAVAHEPVSLWTLTYSGGAGSAPSVGLAVTGATSGFAGVVSVVVSGATAGAGTIIVRSTGWKDLVEGEIISGGSWSAATITAGTLSNTSHQAVYSYGPRYDATPGEKAYHLRRVIDGGDGYSVQGADGAWGLTNGTLAGAGTPDDAEYTYPRLGVDSYDNVYLPYFETTGSTQRSMVAVSKSGSVLFQLNANGTSANLPAGLAVAVDPAVPRFGSSNLNRAEFVYLATNRGGISPVVDTNTLYKVPLLTVGKTTGSPRTVANIAVAGGTFKRFTTAAITAPAGPKTLAAPQLTAAADYISATSFFGEVFVTDGKSVRVFNPVDDTVLDYKPKKGRQFARFSLLTHWRGRLVFGRGADSANNWAMARQGDPYDMDTGPQVVDTQQPVIGSDSRMGECPDTINFMAPLMDDFMLVAGDHTLQRMTGDPMAGGEFDLVSDITGGAFGQQAWCKDPNGVAYFMGSRGSAFRLPPPYTNPERLTQFTIEDRLLDVDLAAYYFVLAWNARDDGLHVFQCPFGAGGTRMAHWFWEQRTGAWEQDEFAIAGLQPTAVYVLDGDDPGDRVVLFGCEDGRLREWSKDALEDDGYAIDSRVLFGPIVPEEEDYEARFTQLQINLSDSQQGCNWELFSGQTADVPGIAQKSGSLHPGRNEIINARLRGSALWLRLRMAARGSRWAYESGSINVVAAGRKRVRI